MPTPVKKKGPLIATTAAALLSGLAMSVSAPTPVRAQQQAQAETEEQLLKDFIHYVRIRQIELATSNANTLLGRGLTRVQFVGLVEDSGRGVEVFEDTIRQAMAIPELEDLAGRLLELFEGGKRDRARNPDEIAANIAMLVGSARARALAEQRLRAAREYAVGQLLQVLETRGDISMELHARRVLQRMGADAVAPLCAALLGVDKAAQRRVAEILGDIGADAALPHLYELRAQTQVNEVRDAAERAIERIKGVVDDSTTLSDRYRELGERYYQEQASLTRFPGEEHQLLWTYDPRIGLFAQAVRTEVFHEARTMELARKAIELDNRNDRAVSLWMAANLSREIDQPAGYENPAYPAQEREAEYYAVAGGSRVVQPVLARAIRDRDTPLAREAIAALDRGAGGKTLWEGFGAERPLVDALTYPDRRVRMDAALALASTEPRSPFEGAERVTPILAAAVRGAGDRFALVLARDLETRQDLAALVEELGYTALAPAGSLAEAEQALVEAPSVDLVVARLPAEATQRTIDTMRVDSRLRATPIVAQLGFTGYNLLRPRYERNAMARIAREGITREQLREGIRQTYEFASGAPISEEESRAYSARAISALQRIAASGGGVFDIRDATRVLTGALRDLSGPDRLDIAQILANVDQKRAQVALMDVAMETGSAERVLLLRRVTDSVKRHGNLLDDRQLGWLVETAIESENEAEATQAAALMGALNLPDRQIVPLILRGE